MTYTVNELITDAYYLTGLVGRGVQTLSELQLNDGLKRLNAFLAVKSADVAMIPYYQQYFFPGVIGQEIYSIPNLISADTLTFVLLQNQMGDQNVRYSMNKIERATYWGISRPLGINSIPFQWMINRTNLGSDIYVFFAPGQATEFAVSGLFQLTNVALNQDLDAIPIGNPITSVSSAFYQEYMRYGLAVLLMQWNNIAVPPVIKEEYQSLINIVMGISPMDWENRKTSFFGGRNDINYAYVRNGSGLWPSY